MKELLGKKITSIFLKDNKKEDSIIFNTDDGMLGFNTYAGCCSETYFSDIIDVKNILGETIIDIEDCRYCDRCQQVNAIPFHKPRQDSDKIWGIKLKSTKGICQIIVRNSSNGYYSGEHSFNPDLKIDDSFFEIKEDYHIKE